MDDEDWVASSAAAAVVVVVVVRCFRDGLSAGSTTRRRGDALT